MYPLKKGLSFLMLALILLISASASANTIAYRGGFVLLSPENGATGVSVTPTLDWSDMPGAIFYDVQVASDSLFTKPVVDITGILAITSEYTVGENVLDDGAKYYWRVRFDDGIITSEWAEPFSFTTTPAIPGIPLLTAPVNGATGVSLTATLDWEGVKGADSYEIQLSADDKFTSPLISETGLTATELIIPEKVLNNNTGYFWRVRAVNAGGSSDFSTAFGFTTIEAAPVAPVLTAPANNATGVSTTPTLDWEGVKDADTYELQLATDVNFTNTILSQTDLTATELSLTGKPLNNNTAYFWRVRAVNTGGSSDFSSTFTFTTIEAVPFVPVLTSPANNATGVSLTATLDWEAVKGADTYDIQLSSDSKFTEIIISDTGITSTEFVIPAKTLTNSTQYFWRVRAVNGGGSSDFSGAFSFTTIGEVPSVPALVTPANGATGQPLVLTLDWDDVSGAKTYSLQVSTDSSFTKNIIDLTGLASSSFEVSKGLSNSTTYYWRVSATNSAGSSEFSSAFSFTTITAAPSVPVLVSPINGATGQPLSLTLNWDDAANAESYELQVSADSSFGKTVISETGLDSSSYTINSGILENLTTYYWRVRSANKSGNSEYSNPFIFTTIVSQPGVPVLTSPSNGATAQPLTLTLDWENVENAKGYQLQVSADSSFATTVIDESNITISQYTVLSGILTNNTWYYWRVKADNGGGSSTFSSAYSFRTIVNSPMIPVLVTPSNGAVDVQRDPLFDWNDVSGATSYNFEISDDSAFSNIVLAANDLDSSQYQISLLLNESTTYYWRVNAENKGGTGEFSEAFSFTTIAPAPQAPGLLTPVNGQKNVNIMPRLDWSDIESDNLESVYELEVALDTSFTNPVLSKTGLSISEHTFEEPLSPTTAHYWRVRAQTQSGTSPWSEVWSFTTETITGLNPISGIIPKEFMLHQNYPNPFNPVTKIKFDIPAMSNVSSHSARIVVYNMLGQTVTTLFQGQLNAGVYEMQWDASMLASGVYFYELKTENFRSIKRMSLIK